MKQNIEDEDAPRVRKVLVGFWVEEILGNQLKDLAWSQRKTLSELLREYCRAALRNEPNIDDLCCDLKKGHGSSIRSHNQPHVKED